MANTYTWDCKTVDTYPTHNEQTDVVYNVHWRVTEIQAALDATLVEMATPTSVTRIIEE
jgi:hypothetical protein